jgi:NADPH:quinone reductase-like Zn-dependent oxidoreductase
LRAIRIHSHGGPDVLAWDDIPDPVVGPGDVLIQVGACAVNSLDIAVREGGTETPIPLPLIPGADVAGEVVDIASDVKTVGLGDRVVVNPRYYCGKCRSCLRGQQSACSAYRVMGWHRDGGYAELVVVPGDHVANIGRTVSYEAAAALPIAFTTAWRMLVSRAEVNPGERVLVLGGSGGVGSAAIQIACLMGARVAATTSTAEKASAIRALGAEVVINYATEDVGQVVKEWTDGDGVDVVVQTIGGDWWTQSLDLVARLGRIVICAAIGGDNPPAGLGSILWKQITVVGSTGGTPLDFEAVVNQLVVGKLTPAVSTTFRMQDAARAHAAFERHNHVGKVVLSNTR